MCCHGMGVNSSGSGGGRGVLGEMEQDGVNKERGSRVAYWDGCEWWRVVWCGVVCSSDGI